MIFNFFKFKIYLMKTAKLGKILERNLNFIFQLPISTDLRSICDSNFPTKIIEIIHFYFIQYIIIIFIQKNKL